jgi:hypothetical protein
MQDWRRDPNSIFEEPPSKDKRRPYKDFVPPGTFERISLLIEDPRLSWPWPYDQMAIDKIVLQIPDIRKDWTKFQLVRLSRIYLAKRWAKMTEPPGKPKPISEIGRLRDTLQEALELINGLSEEAKKKLDENYKCNLQTAPHLLELKLMVDRFLNDYGLSRRIITEEDPDTRGRTPSLIERDFQAALDEVWLLAHDGVMPRKGFPSFQKGIVEILDPWVPKITRGRTRDDFRRSSSRSRERRRKKSEKIDN